MRSFDGDKAMIQSHYGNHTFFESGDKNPEKCDILFFTDDKVSDSSLPHEFDSLDAWQVK